MTAEHTKDVDRSLPAREWFGHPRGIFILALVEMWERFSYYGMRALLILYLTEHFPFGDAEATAIYGAYTSLVYGVAVIGGWAADRFIGGWRSIVIGALIIMAGHLGLVLEGNFPPEAAGTQQLLFLSLALIITGTALFKPSSTVLVATLYPDGDGRKMTGFYIFYLGINTGAALAALICGWLGQSYGWGFGFGAAAVGMALGLVILLLNRRDLAPKVDLPAQGAAWSSFFIAVALLLLTWSLVQRPAYVGLVLAAALLAALGLVGRFMIKEATLQEQRQLRLALVLVASASIFWSLFEQAGSSLNLFAARAVDLSVGPITMLSSQTQFFNPAYILLLTPAFALLWPFLARRGLEPSIGWKHVLGLSQAGLGFVCLVIGIESASSGDGQVAVGWLALAYLLHTTGELCLSPTGYSAMTTLAPARIGGLVMGLWLFALSIGNFLGSRIAGLTARPVGQSVDRAVELDIYSQVFGGAALLAGVAALLLALFAPRLKRWAAGSQ